MVVGVLPSTSWNNDKNKMVSGIDSMPQAPFSCIDWYVPASCRILRHSCIIWV